MNVQFLEPAQAELTETVGYCNAQTEGLGFEFSGINYQVRGDTLLIVAVTHLHRDPQSWGARIPKRLQ